jgi:hypothetical protein
VFENGRVSTLSWDDQGWIWRFRAPALDPIPLRLAFFSPEYRKGQVFVTDVAKSSDTLPSPIRYPLDRFLYATLLAARDALMFHSCGVDLDGRGLLFVGESEAGKSTTATLWNAKPGVTILSDERTAVREIEEQLWLFGTPWSGTAGLYAAKRSTLEAVFLLRQGPKNQALRLSPMQALTRLPACIYWPVWSQSGMDRVLRVVGRIVQRIPCFELTFAPDSRIVSFVTDLVSQLPQERI